MATQIIENAPTFIIKREEDGRKKLQVGNDILWLDEKDANAILNCFLRAVKPETECLITETTGVCIIYDTNGVIAAHIAVGKLRKDGSEFIILLSYMFPGMKGYNTYMFYSDRKTLDDFIFDLSDGKFGDITKMEEKKPTPKAPSKPKKTVAKKKTDSDEMPKEKPVEVDGTAEKPKEPAKKTTTRKKTTKVEDAAPVEEKVEAPKKKTTTSKAKKTEKAEEEKPAPKTTTRKKAAAPKAEKETEKAEAPKTTTRKRTTKKKETE